MGNNNFLSLYSSTKTLKHHLVILLAGKIGELLAFSFIGTPLFFGLADRKDREYRKKQHLCKKQNTFSLTGFLTLAGIDNTWRAATSLIFSLIQKRYLANKNFIIPKLLHFLNNGSLYEAPGPPASNILLPAKRYENFKRSFNAQQNKTKTSLGISEKLQLHQQQRLVKRLYKLPIKEHFRSEILTNTNKREKSIGFANSTLILGPLDSIVEKPTNFNWHYRNKVLNRHRNYLNNQWWNGQLPEHNTETTFLSDIDWRYTFVESIGDIIMDFPDTDQHYNNRERRWLLNFGY